MFMSPNGIYITIQVMGDSQPLHIRSSSRRVRSIRGWFFYIENFLHEVDFDTILPIMLIEYHCGC